MSFRPCARSRRRRYPAPPRSLLRRLLDYALTAAILLLLALVAARLDRVETRRIAGDAVVNDGDSITLKGERIRLRGIDAPEYNQTCREGRRDLSVRPPLARGAGRAGQRAARSTARAGSATATAGCSASARPAAIDLNRAAGRGRAGRSPMATMRTPSKSARQRGAGLWAGSFERPRDWRVEHGEHGRKRTRPVRADASTGCGRSSAFHDACACAVVCTRTRRKR